MNCLPERNDSLFLIRNQSTTPYNGMYVDKKDLKEDYKSVLDIAEGEVTGVINLGSAAAIIKNINEKLYSNTGRNARQRK